MRPALLLYLLHMKVSYCPCFDVCYMPFFLMWGEKKVISQQQSLALGHTWLLEKETHSIRMCSLFCCITMLHLRITFSKTRHLFIRFCILQCV